MQCVRRYLGALVCAALAAVDPAYGQTGSIPTAVAGTWRVIVDGDSRDRQFMVTGALPDADGGYTLDATYGWIDGAPSRVKARVSSPADGSRLVITTQANSVILVAPSADGAFAGTLTTANGRALGVRLTRMSGATPSAGQPNPGVALARQKFTGRWALFAAQWGSWDIDIRDAAEAPDGKIQLQAFEHFDPARPLRLRIDVADDGGLVVHYARPACKGMADVTDNGIHLMRFKPINTGAAGLEGRMISRDCVDSVTVQLRRAP